MVINGLIDISFTAVVGKMVTVAFVDTAPMFRPLSVKKLAYIVKKYSPDALVLFSKKKPLDKEFLQDLKGKVGDVPLILFTYSPELISLHREDFDECVLFIPDGYEDRLSIGDLPGDVRFRISEGVYERGRSVWGALKERVEVVSPTLEDVFQWKSGILWRKFWL